MELVEVLGREPDLLLRVTDLLDLQDLAALEATCAGARRLVQDWRLWRRRMARWSAARHLGTDWSARLAGREERLRRAAGLAGRWAEGRAARQGAVDLGQEPVADLALDETGLVVGLRRGEVRLYHRCDLSILWSRAMGVRVSGVGLGPGLVVAVPLVSPPRGPDPTVVLLHRDTGDTATTLTLDHPVTTLLMGRRGLILLSTGMNSNSETNPKLSVYKVTTTCSNNSPDQNLDTEVANCTMEAAKQYGLPVSTDHLCLSSCGLRFLSSSSPTLSLHCLATGATLSTLAPPVPSVAPATGWSLHALGWLDPRHVWVAWRNAADPALPYSLATLALAGGQVATFEKIGWEGGRGGAATNWRALRAVTRRRHLATVGPEGWRGEQDATLAMELGVNLQRVVGVWGDATGLATYATHVLPHLTSHRGNIVILTEFL